METWWSAGKLYKNLKCVSPGTVASNVAKDLSAYLPFSTLCTPHRSNPSSVRVPVCQNKESRIKLNTWVLQWLQPKAGGINLGSINSDFIITTLTSTIRINYLVTEVQLWLVLTLSKQTRLICPQMLILCGLMQKMPMCLRRRWAYTMPAVMAAGSAGGTVMVMMSRDSMMMVLAGT